VSTRDYLEKDYYKVLGVSKDASTSDIKKAYRKLARTYHPDANKGDAASEDRFKEISEAYDVLSDDKRRKEYDEARALFGSGGFRLPGSARTGPGMGGFNFDLGDLFASGSGGGPGGLGDMLGGLFGQRRASTTSQQPRRGGDVETEATMSFSDAVEGVTLTLPLTTAEPCGDCAGTGARKGTTPRVCPDCLGTGQTSRNAGGFGISEPCRACRGRGLIVDDPCPTCGGSGRAKSTRTIQARIPAGVRDGQRVRLKGKGAPGERGGPNGDLYVLAHVRPHPVFGRRDDHLTLTLPVTFVEAALGAEVKVPTLGGAPITLRIPAGTANGRVFRVRGRGGPRRDGSKGDLLVTINVEVPRRVDGPAREALEKFREATAGEDPRAALLDLAKAD
jgi:molecular chaperone DnaJ